MSVSHSVMCLLCKYEDPGLTLRPVDLRPGGVTVLQPHFKGCGDRWVPGTHTQINFYSLSSAGRLL